MKKFVAMVGPVFDPEDEGKERVRIKVYLESDAYDHLAEMAGKMECSPAKLLSDILANWACGVDDT